MRMWVILPKPSPSPVEKDTLKITVTDGTDPVASATITIGEDSETTDAEGKAEFELEYGDYEAEVSATGYVTSTESIAFRSNHKNFSVTLVEEW